MADGRTDIGDRTQGARTHKTKNDLKTNAKAASMQVPRRGWPMRSILA